MADSETKNTVNSSEVYENIPYDQMQNYYTHSTVDSSSAHHYTDGETVDQTTSQYEYWNDPAYQAYYQQNYPEYYASLQSQTGTTGQAPSVSGLGSAPQSDIAAPGTTTSTIPNVNQTQSTLTSSIPNLQPAAPGTVLMNTTVHSPKKQAPVTNTFFATTQQVASFTSRSNTSSTLMTNTGQTGTNQEYEDASVPYPEGYVPSKASLAAQKLLTKSAVIKSKTPASISTRLLQRQDKQETNANASTFSTTTTSVSINSAPLTGSGKSGVTAPLTVEEMTNKAEAKLDESKKDDEKSKKNQSKKRIFRAAGGEVWEDETLNEWDPNDFRIFCGDIGNEVTDEILERVFGKYPSFQKAKVVRDKRTNKSKGFGFVSFKDPSDFVAAMKEINGKYVGHRPIKLRKSNWNERNIKKQDIKKLKLEGSAIHLKKNTNKKKSNEEEEDDVNKPDNDQQPLEQQDLNLANQKVMVGHSNIIGGGGVPLPMGYIQTFPNMSAAGHITQPYNSFPYRR